MRGNDELENQMFSRYELPEELSPSSFRYNRCDDIGFLLVSTLFTPVLAMLALL